MSSICFAMSRYACCAVARHVVVDDVVPIKTITTDCTEMRDPSLIYEMRVDIGVCILSYILICSIYEYYMVSSICRDYCE